ncbi:MAG: FAD/NAD(P)-binding oxidoreductase [Candidatus Accumulibacter sp.]|uniref:FAD/NAD(P)-binding oxidoreductase n=1 Tax=Accumulibacter sp. TaxID=2053492 RepID=UPI00287B2C99|nr:FAD/NAD(P)-binding oxidoreductase [Accumulibacter sp.]MDS4012883.1 FAD/NAD(P)-binding oxidoreductase [Accumulibacter sp.]
MNRINNDRKRLLQALGTSAIQAGAGRLPGSALAASSTGRKLGRVVGACFGGGTVAKYLRKWGDGAIEVVLIDRNKEFASCPTAHEVLGSNRKYATLGHSLDGIVDNWGIKVVHAEITGFDAEKRRVRTDKAGEFEFAYGHLIFSPSIDFVSNAIAGYDEKHPKRYYTPGRQARRRSHRASNWSTSPVAAAASKPPSKHPTPRASGRPPRPGEEPSCRANNRSP